MWKAVTPVWMVSYTRFFDLLKKSLFSPQAFVQNPQKTIFVKVVIYYPKLEMKIPLSRYFKI